MHIAALYDVHGNLPALEAVLQDLPDDATIVVGGDVAAGPFPSETLERLRRLGDRARWIRGNADRELMAGEEGLAPPDMIEWVRSRLDREQIEFLHGLPARLEVDVPDLGRVLFCHASPRNDVDIVLDTTPEERVAPLLSGLAVNVVVCGHTHMQFDRDIAGTRLVNAGSVGMPYEDEPGAYWLLLGAGVEHRRTPHDEAPLRETGFPGRFLGPERPSRAEVRAFWEAHAVR